MIESPRRRAMKAAWNAANKDKRRAYGWKVRGLPTPTTERTTFCECCGIFCVVRLDHDHTTGKFRGWLCNNCNLGIGKLGDCEAGVIRALNYLRNRHASFEC